MGWSMICAFGLALTLAGLTLTEMAYTGRIPLKEQTGKRLAAFGATVAVLAVYLSPA